MFPAFDVRNLLSGARVRPDTEAEEQCIRLGFVKACEEPDGDGYVLYMNPQNDGKTDDWDR